MELRMKKLLSKPLFRFTILALLILILIFISRAFSVDKEKIDAFLNKIPLTYRSLVFILLYVVSNFFILGDPKEILKIIGAVFFGAHLSTLLIYISEIINASIFFNMSRVLGKEFVERSLRGKFKKFYEKLSDLNFTWLSLLRLNLLIPYRVLDLSLGVSNVSFKKYILAVLFASLPRIFFWQFIFKTVGELSLEKMMFYFNKQPLTGFLFLLYFIFSLIVIFKVKKRLR
jgi:uncharacterized membrane protein YdjX (TVP38/TMEM64 family)